MRTIFLKPQKNVISSVPRDKERPFPLSFRGAPQGANPESHLVVRVLLLAFIAITSVSPAHAAAPTIQEVTSPHGLKAWLIEDHKLPLISLRFAFHGGVEQDPPSAQGM
ncbi:MAG: hypothetical protein AB7E52_04540, partial [Bdellovibrionales bacterium]